MTTPLRDGVLTNLAGRAAMALANDGHHASTRLPAHMLASLVAEVQAHRAPPAHTRPRWVLTDEDGNHLSGYAEAGPDGTVTFTPQP